MYLTREEERVLNGENGWANQVCMKILVRLGELFGAKKLIPIDSAHVSGVSYKTLGDAPIEFLKALADNRAKVKVRSTINPQGSDREYLNKKLDPNINKKQTLIVKQFKRMGFAQSLTCTPYYLEKPARGSHLAWAESSAVVYANSILNAWTNREGGPSALAAAVTGKTPDYGIHRQENRQPQILVEVKTKLGNETEYGALGAFLGKLLADKIPIIKGLDGAPENCLKQLSAAIASTGMTSMFYTEDSRWKTNKLEKITIEKRDIEKTIEDLTTASTSQPDLVFLGCPHCSAEEIKKIAQQTRGKQVKNNTELWVCTSPCVKNKTREHVSIIEKSGGHVLAGVCTVVSWTEKLGIKTIMTNSAKTAY
ncbi:MAG: aconitase X catalytic domain-containing protein [Candidatus Bathyarchaeia archaeon]